MEQSTTIAADPANRIGLRFLLLGMLALAGSMLVGALAAFKFVYPELLESLPFHKIRPMHVSLAVAWIFLAAVGGIYYYLPNACRLPLYSARAAAWHFWLFLVTGLAILAAYATGHFGGREYFEFPALLALPIFASWILFGVNYFRTVTRERRPWPVYYWMWGTGIVFFFLTFTEAYLWLIPFFRENMVREVTVQWKAYGALVGSWNMLVYGTAIFVMCKVAGDDKMASSKLAFGLYFLGLFNLMFGWAHHAYPVPMAEWIRHFAYFVSMTELFILGKIIWDWRSSLTTYRRHRHRQAFRFMIAADIWIFLNLILALIISVPAANLFTHGTHVTVAHAMGTTIGINTMILFASIFFILEANYGHKFRRPQATLARWGFWIANGCLLIVLAALLSAGIGRGTYAGGSFREMMDMIELYLIGFAAAGVGLMIGLWMVLACAIQLMWSLAFVSKSEDVASPVRTE
jgi:nitric oxide reductase subunit B